MSNVKAMQASVTKSRLYKRHFSSEDGEELLYDLMGYSHFLSPTTVPGDPITSATNEGKREVILYILSMVKKSEKDLLRLIDTESDKLKNQRESNYVTID